MIRDVWSYSVKSPRALELLWLSWYDYNPASVHLAINVLLCNKCTNSEDQFIFLSFSTYNSQSFTNIGSPLVVCYTVMRFISWIWMLRVGLGKCASELVISQHISCDLRWNPITSYTPYSHLLMQTRSFHALHHTSTTFLLKCSTVISI